MSLAMSSLVLAPALVFVVVCDLLYRRIPNRLVLALLLSWVALAGWNAWHGANGTSGARWGELSDSAVTALCVLVLGYLLFVMRWMGAGDVKLMSVLCLWLGDDALSFVIVTTLVGGVLALGMPLLRQIERSLALSLMHVNGWLPRPAIPSPVILRAQPPAGIPYGVAIASGAALVLWGKV